MAAPLQQPKKVYGLGGGGVNLDQEVDHDSQDHPELSRLAMDMGGGAADRDFLRQEVENEEDDNVDGVISNPRRGDKFGGDHHEVEVLGVNKEYDANETGLEDDDGLFNDHQDMGEVMPNPNLHRRNNLGVGGAGQWHHRQQQIVQPPPQGIHPAQQQYYIQAPHQFHPSFGGRGL